MKTLFKTSGFKTIITSIMKFYKKKSIILYIKSHLNHNINLKHVKTIILSHICYEIRNLNRKI